MARAGVFIAAMMTRSLQVEDTMKTLTAVAITAALAQTTAFGAETPPASGAAPSMVVLHCGHLFDAAAGKLTGAMTIVAEGKRIKDVKAGFVDADSIRAGGPQPESFTYVDLK